MASLTMTMGELSSQLEDIGLESEMPDIPAADILSQPLDIFRSHLANLIASAVHCDISSAYNSIADSSMADLEVIVPKLNLMDKSKPPIGSSIDVSQKLQPSSFFTAPYPDGPRIRFYFSSLALPRLLLPYIEDRKASYGQHLSEGLKDTFGAKKKVIVEFSSPNVGSQFKGTHLRSTLIGAFISNMYECMGWDVVRLNHLGDWGKDLALLAVGFQRFGSQELLESKPLEHMLEVYLKIKALLKPEQEETRKTQSEGCSSSDIDGQGLSAERDAFFRDLESQTEDAVGLWAQFRNLAIDHMKPSYERMGIRFDDYSGESQVKPETMSEVEEKLKAEGILEEIEGGSWLIDFAKHAGKAGKGVTSQALRNHDGTSTYLLRDVGAVIDRHKAYEFDKMIYVVSSRQSSHFQKLSLVLKLMGYTDLEKKIQHVGFGEIQGLEEHMNGPLLLDNIIDQCSSSIQQPSSSASHSKLDERLDKIQLAIGALLCREVATKKRSQSYTIDPDHISPDNGVTGLDLQQFYAQIVSKISELEVEDLEAVSPDPSVFEDDVAAELLGALARFPEVTATAFKSLEPHTIFMYMTQLSESLELLEPSEDDDHSQEGDFARQVGPGSSIVEDPPGARRARLALYRCTMQVVENGMRLLGFLTTKA
ncbi:arginyl-tRNA synthetase [Dactylonectria macrodidyma]|uniref:arginine--tRNA ligase n=1 Tax=Dactylonectria macrodidyma TaxID=307937 RepID=A0A9P9EQR2_9HYPO|nr:arginyl-tRNA synthetase [Dactylonectria macrodidyma]